MSVIPDPAARRVAAAHLRRRLGAVAAVAGITALGATVTLAAASGAWETHVALDQTLDQARVADVSVDVDVLDEARRARLEALPEVEELSGVAFTALRPAGTGMVAGTDLVGVAPLDDRATETMDRLLVQEGRLPVGANEVILDPLLARRLDVGVGDRLPLETYRQHQIDDVFTTTEPPIPTGPAFNAEVVGLAWPVDEVTSDNQGETGIVVLSAAGARTYLEGSDGMGVFRTVLRARLDDGTADAPAYLHDVFRIFGPAADTTFSQARPEVFAAAAHTIDVQAAALALFALGAALATAYAAGQAGSRLAAALGAEDDAPLRALGVERLPRTAAASLPPVAGLAAGVALAVPLAVALASMVEFGLADRLHTDPGWSVDPVVLGVGAAALFGLLTLRVHLAALRATGSHPIGRTSLRSAAGSPLPTALGIRTAFSADRLAMAAAGVAVAGIAASVVFAYSLEHLTRTPRLYGLGWDDEVSLQAGGDAIAARERPRLAADPRVAGLAHYGVFETSFGGEERISGLRLSVIKGDVGPTVRAGRLPHGDGEVAIDPSAVPGPGPDLGAVLRTTSLSDDASVEVVGHLTATGLGQFVVDAPAADRMNAQVSDSGFLLRWAPGVDVAAAEAELQERFVEVDPPRPSAEVRNLESVQAVPRTLATFFLLIGLASVANALVLAARRRGRDLAVTQALGFTRGEASGVLLGESLAIAVVAIPLGLLVGVGLGRLVWEWVVDAVGVLLATVVPLHLLLPLALGALALVVLFGWAVARLVVRSRPGEPLRAAE
jgi:ABC-type lipoprotein release transport system permease subunit